MTWGNVTWPVPPTPTGASVINSLTNQSLKHQQYISREENECKHYPGSGFEIMFQNYPGEGHEMARGGNPTVVFDSTRQQVFANCWKGSRSVHMFQVVLHFNSGTSDPDGDGNFDCIPAVDNFQVSTSSL